MRSWAATEAVLRRDFIGQKAAKGGKLYTEWIDGQDPIWRNHAILAIRRRDVVTRLDEIKAERGKHAARHAFAAIRKFYNWCAEGDRFGVEASSCDRINAKKVLGLTKCDLRRQRVFDDAELQDVWRADQDAGYPFGPLVQLLILTG